MFSWLKKIPSQSLQDVAERVDRAYTLFFNNVRRKLRTSPPRFQSPGRYKSYTLKQCRYKFLSGNVVQFGRKKYRYFKSREFEGKVKTAAVKRDQCGNYWPIVATDQKRVLNKPGSGGVVGFDFGMKTFLVGSNKTAIDFPLVLRGALSKIRKLHRHWAAGSGFPTTGRRQKPGLPNAMGCLLTNATIFTGCSAMGF